MAVNIKSKVAAIPVGRFLCKLYKKVFPDYHHKVELDITDRSVYLVKARELVAPLIARGMDMVPFVHGKKLYDLLMRMENSAKEAIRSTEIDNDWKKHPRQLEQAILESDKKWSYLITIIAYNILGEKYPYTC